MSSLSKTSFEKKKCLFCPSEYLQQQHCNRHMQMKHGYAAEANRQKEREEKNVQADALKVAKRKARDEEKVEKKRKLEEEAAAMKVAKSKARDEEKVEKKRKLEEEAAAMKEAKLKKKEAKQKERDEARSSDVVPFDFVRDILGGAILCGKCNKAFTSIEERDKHEKKHDDPKNFVCSKCDKRFKKMENKDFHEVKCGKKPTNEPRNDVDDYDEDDEDGFTLNQSALSGFAKIYRLQFARGVINLFPRLKKAMAEASDQLLTIQRNNENVKYCVSLHCVFYKPTEPDCVTDPPAVFTSGTSILLPASNIDNQMEINYDNLLQSIQDYETNGSGWILLHLVHLDVRTAKYNPLYANY